MYPGLQGTDLEMDSQRSPTDTEDKRSSCADSYILDEPYEVQLALLCGATRARGRGVCRVCRVYRVHLSQWAALNGHTSAGGVVWAGLV